MTSALRFCFAGAGEGGGDAAGAHLPSSTPKARATVFMSLSPRPETLTTMVASGGSARATSGRAAMAWALSSAHRMPSVRPSC